MWSTYSDAIKKSLVSREASVPGLLSLRVRGLTPSGSPIQKLRDVRLTQLAEFLDELSASVSSDEQTLVTNVFGELSAR